MAKLFKEIDIDVNTSAGKSESELICALNHLLLIRERVLINQTKGIEEKKP